MSLFPSQAAEQIKQNKLRITGEGTKRPLTFWEMLRVGASGSSAESMFGGGVPERSAVLVENVTGQNIRTPNIIPQEDVYENSALDYGTTLGAEGSVYRYPASPAIRSDSDYVLMTFFKYLAPGKQGANVGDVYRTDYNDLGEDENRIPQVESTNYKNSYLNVYNNMAQGDGASRYERTTAKQIMLYMPEDISSGFTANWNGKAISTAAKGMLTGATATGVGNKISGMTEALTGAIQRMGATWSANTIRGAITSITGDTLTNDELLGAIGGVVTNPNTELLFNSMQMRTFQLKWKLVPRNATEAEQVKGIINTIKRSMLPGTSVEQVFGISFGDGVTAGFISVPDLVKVSFMSGAGPADYLPQYKMCAITNVGVNYTPDGSYAKTIGADGSVGGVVATELTVDFQETKLVYKEEVDRF